MSTNVSKNPTKAPASNALFCALGQAAFDAGIEEAVAAVVTTEVESAEGRGLLPSNATALAWSLERRDQSSALLMIVPGKKSLASDTINDAVQCVLRQALEEDVTIGDMAQRSLSDSSWDGDGDPLPDDPWHIGTSEDADDGGAIWIMDGARSENWARPAVDLGGASTPIIAYLNELELEGAQHADNFSELVQFIENASDKEPTAVVAYIAKGLEHQIDVLSSLRKRPGAEAIAFTLILEHPTVASVTQCGRLGFLQVLPAGMDSATVMEHMSQSLS